MKELIDIDPLSGVQTWFDYDDETDTAAIFSIQDVEPHLDANKVLANDDDYSRKGIKKSFWHYAHIPAVVIEKWMREDGINVFNKDHEKAVMRKLNDPENRFLKTTVKRHAR